jgi:hypothetical protein
VLSNLEQNMKRIGLLMCAFLIGIALSGTSASAHGWRHHHHGWYHHHHGWFWGPHYGWRYHAAGSPVRHGPFCWLTTDDARGFGYYKVCDDARKYFRHHRHHRR